jgi:hypothetical protein
MKIIPKIADSDYNNLDYIKHFISDTDSVELQMLDSDFLSSFNKCRIILDRYTNINYVVLHVPFSMLNIESYLCNRETERSFVQLIVESIKYSLSRDISIDILFHCACRAMDFGSMGGFSFLNHITAIASGTPVSFLIENSIINPNMDDKEMTVEESILVNTKYTNINFCFDLCHWQSSEYMISEELEIPVVMLNKLKNIHFSFTRNHEGFKNKVRTHGVSHYEDLGILRDLNYIKRKGIDLNKVNVVTEINESDYIHRPDMTKEIKLLKLLDSDGIV